VVVVAVAAAKATNPEVQQLWLTLMQRWITHTTAAIQTERERGYAPATVPAADLSVALNMLNERVMAATFTAEEPAIPQERVIDTLVHIWMASIYDADGASGSNGRLSSAANTRSGSR
jgi:TetR/AcrR family transcriptional regulator, ethionamide resistance regulator